MKHKRPSRHFRKMRSGKRIIINPYIPKRRKVRMAMNYREEAKKLIEQINESIREEARHPDKEGFVFLTNQDKGKSMPFDFAREHGFIQPVFEVKKPKLINFDPIPEDISKEIKQQLKENMEKSLKWQDDTMEGIWVKDMTKEKYKKA